jgi:hypothetical protein
MYNTKIACTYHTPEVFLETDQVNESEKEFIRNVIYRQELLDIFGKEDFTENEMTYEISELYKRVNNCDKLKQCMRKASEKFINQNDNEETGLLILFSYDYMYLTHLCICEFLEKGEVSEESINKLYCTLIK